METYRYVLELEIEVDAPSSADAEELIEDIFGVDELENFDVRVVHKMVIQQ